MATAELIMRLTLTSQEIRELTIDTINAQMNAISDAISDSFEKKLKDLKEGPKKEPK